MPLKNQHGHYTASLVKWQKVYIQNHCIIQTAEQIAHHLKVDEIKIRMYGKEKGLTFKKSTRRYSKKDGYYNTPAKWRKEFKEHFAAKPNHNRPKAVYNNVTSDQIIAKYI